MDDRYSRSCVLGDAMPWVSHRVHDETAAASVLGRGLFHRELRDQLIGASTAVCGRPCSRRSIMVVGPGLDQPAGAATAVCGRSRTGVAITAAAPPPVPPRRPLMEQMDDTQADDHADTAVASARSSNAARAPPGRRAVGPSCSGRSQAASKKTSGVELGRLPWPIRAGAPSRPVAGDRRKWCPDDWPVAPPPLSTISVHLVGRSGARASHPALSNHIQRSRPGFGRGRQ
jgi:hypothetical protein